VSRPPGRSAPAAGPPPWPVLVAPLSAVAVQPHGAEVELVAEWMVRPHVERFWHQAWPVAGWSAEVARQHAGDHSRPWLVLLDRRPVAYVEVYRVARDVIATRHPVETHDLGLHIAVGDPDRTGHGLGPRVLAAVAAALLATDHACGRVIGDPDAGHHVARRAFAAAGFEPLAEVDLPHKRAALVAHRRPSTHPTAAEASEATP
jgi:lysine N-acyltransferase